MQRFRGGLVFKTHRLLYHLRVIKKNYNSLALLWQVREYEEESELEEDQTKATGSRPEAGPSGPEVGPSGSEAGPSKKMAPGAGGKEPLSGGGGGGAGGALKPWTRFRAP